MFECFKRAMIPAFCMLSAVLPLSAQNLPPAVDTRTYDWKSIDSEHYEVIFPDFMEREGRYVSSVLEYLYPLQQESLKPTRHHHYPVVLNPDYLGPNGYVSTAPRRSLFYGTPDTGMPGDWFTLLAVHEGRHMFQFDAMNRNAVRGAYFMLGETAFTPLMPLWWFEGDAVMMETVLTQSGRGRNPSFTAPFKALMLEEKVFNYNKMLLGSRKDFIPNHYTFGYLMEAYIRATYDMSAGETLFEQYSKTPIPALGPHLAMKKAAGKGAGAVYREMAAEYAQFWKEQTAALELTPVRADSEKSRSYFTFHGDLAALEDGSVIAFRTDLERGAEIIRIRDGKESVLCRAYVYNALSQGGKFLIWDEIEESVKFDSARSRIALYDLETGKKTLLASASRYLHPALSPDGQTAALVEWKENGAASLVLMLTSDGRVLKTVPIPAGEIWSDISFTDGGKSLLYISCGVTPPAGGQGKRLEKLSLADGTKEILLDGGYENIQMPKEADGIIYYVSNYSGIDTVYALESDGSRYQVLVRPLGAYSPQIRTGTGELVFIDYADSRGSVVSSASIPRPSWTPLERVTVNREEFFAPVAASESGTGTVIPENIPLSLTPSADYSFFMRGNRIDAWGLEPGTSFGDGITAYVNADNIGGIQSQTLKFGYDFVNKSLGADYTYRYRGFLPDLIVQTGSVLRDMGGDSFNESWALGGIEFPLGGGAAGSTQWQAFFGLTAGGRLRKTEAQLPLRSYLNAGISNFRTAFELNASYEIDPVSSFADHRYVRAGLAVPGVFPADSFSFGGEWERLSPGDMYYAGFARGYSALDGLEAVKGTADYSVPLLYPDFAVGSLLYFSMVKLDVFYDRRYTLDTRSLQSSVGAQLDFYFLPLQLPFELNAGLRYAWQIENRKGIVSFVLMNIPF